jgi:hypothetical protein
MRLHLISTKASQEEKPMNKSTRQNRLTLDGYTFSQGELDWARQNLDKLRRTARGNMPLYTTMIFTFILGLIIYFVADGISLGLIATPAGLRADLMADFLHNLGVVLWSSVVLVFCLEVVVEFQKKRWQRYVELIEHVLNEQGHVATPNTDDSEANIASQLAAIQNRLSSLDQLQADVTALKAMLETKIR